MSWVDEIIEATILPVRNIGGFIADVTIEELSEDILDITSHPVDQGAEITDHAKKTPSRVSMTVAFGGNIILTTTEIYRNFRDLQSSRTPFSVVTGKRIYNNMLIESLSLTEDFNTGSTLNLRLGLREIITTSVSITTVPAREKQLNPEVTDGVSATGKKQAQGVSEEKSRSVLRSFGDIFE